jgi:hypothetical protein
MSDTPQSISFPPETIAGFSQSRPSGSSLERAAACPISFSLPQVTRAGIYAEQGTAIHAFIRARLIGTALIEALAFVPEDLRDTCRGIDLQKIVGEMAIVRSEISYAIDVKERTVRVLGENIHRQYEKAAKELGAPLTPYEVPLTLDAEGRTRDGVEIAGDVKTGWKAIVPVREHRQVRAEAYARALHAGADVVGARIWKVIEGGQIKTDPHLFEPLELDEVGDDMFEIIEGVHVARKRFQSDGEISMNPGPWCEHCPSAPLCPARIELARAIVTQGGSLVASLTKMTPEQEWQSWTMVSTAMRLFDEIKDSLKTIATQRFMQGEPISSPDGLEHVKPIEVTKSNFKRESALALLRELGADEDQIRMLWEPFTYEQFRVVKTKKPVKKRAKKTPELAAPDTTLRGLPALPVHEDRSIEQLERDGDAARSPNARMREKEDDR